MDLQKSHWDKHSRRNEIVHCIEHLHHKNQGKGQRIDFVYMPW
jgi:hypothetical protein